MDESQAAKLVLRGGNEDIVSLAEKELHFNVADNAFVSEAFLDEEDLDEDQQVRQSVFTAVKNFSIPGAKVIVFNHER